MSEKNVRSLTIDREDMLALTRRMTVKRTSITRIAGAYMDPDGFVDGTFNTRFLNLSISDKERNLEIAKSIPFAETNKVLKRYMIPEQSRGKNSMYQLLAGIRSSGFENDALLDIFYNVVAERYHSDRQYGVFLFHDRYDIPAKAADHVRLGEPEHMFEYLIYAICPVSGDYVAGEPECGFLFPAYSQGGALVHCVDVYQADRSHGEWTGMLLG